MRLKKRYNKTLKILQLDGGGLKGIMFLVFLTELEKLLDKKCCEIFDLMIGTSTGGIIAALLASGKAANEVLLVYKNNTEKVFNKRFLWLINPITWFSGSRYKRKYIDNFIKKEMSMAMKMVKSEIILTGVNMRDARHTHFIKSYKSKYADIPLYIPVNVTYSAPTYFGYFKDKKDFLRTGNPKGGIWSDGGVGVQNCTLMKAYIEAVKYKNKKDDYFILSCGCGYTGLEGCNDFIISQIIDFIPIAQEQAIVEQIKECLELRVNFFRVDGKIQKKHYAIDKFKYINEYEKYGKEWIVKYMKELIE